MLPGGIAKVKVRCISCGRARKKREYMCRSCGSLFEIIPEKKYRGNLKEDFPYISQWVNLGETETPMISGDAISFKLDYYHPTYSYKDRGSRTLVSWIKSDMGTERPLNEDSSGNAGASIAAYGRKAGFQVNIFASEGSNMAKIRQIEAYGAKVHFVNGSREEVAYAAMNASGVYAGHGYVPEFRDGIRTLAYEIFNQNSGKVPDRIFLPLSAGTLFLGVYSGFSHLLESGEIKELPKFVVVQPEGIDPVCSAVNGNTFDPEENRKSIADALVTRKPPLKEKILKNLKEGGRCVSVDDDEIMVAWKKLAGMGILTEYSSAAAYAAYLKKPMGEKPLIVLTGNGLKSISA